MNLEREENPSTKEFECPMTRQNDEPLNTHLYPQMDFCPECGETTYREGGCPLCISCGWSPCK
jgi:hypothetical protein